MTLVKSIATTVGARLGSMAAMTLVAYGVAAEQAATVEAVVGAAVLVAVEIAVFAWRKEKGR